MSGSSSLDETFKTPDPFKRGEFIQYRFSKYVENAGLSRNEWCERNVRLYVSRVLKPRMFDWLSRLGQMSADVIFNNQVTLRNVLPSVQNFATSMLEMSADDDNLELLFRQLPSLLINRSESKEISKRMVPFLLRHFTTFRAAMRYAGAENSHSVQEIESDQLLSLLSQAAQKCDLDPVKQYNGFNEVLKDLILSKMCTPDVLISATLSTYTILCRNFFSHVISERGEMETSTINSVKRLVLLWLEQFPKRPADRDGNSAFDATSVAQTAERSLHTIVIDLLVDKVYNLTIIQFPKSFCTIQALRYALSATSDYGRDRIVGQLVADVNSKLLCVSVDTSTILDGYAACVESLRELDPSCAILQRVCAVIKDYLKKRPDTVRKIITYITSEKRDQLAEHLGTKRGTVLDEEEFAGTNDDFLPEAMEMRNWDKWIPDPPDANPGQSGHVRQSADVFNMLISVYGSKELFVKEYRKLLAERLTSSLEKDPAFEQRYLDVLKQRFNEGELQQCEVMLKDISESVAIDKTAASRHCVPISGCVISSHFWPNSELSDVVEEFPAILEDGLKCYEESFKEHKSSRKLNWLRSWGWVEVTIELGGVQVDKLVSHANASVIYLFTEKDGWTVNEVCEKLHITKGVSRRRLDWWTNQGMLVQELPAGATSEVWRLSDSASGVESAQQEESEDEDQMAMEDAADAVDALEIYWTYTRNFIGQHDTVKPERIHKIFRMFASPSSQGPSMDTVLTFLHRKVKQNLLLFGNGSFRVLKDPPPVDKC